MGSGSSSQVKTIHDTPVINNTAVLTGKETTTSNKTITRAVTDPNMPLTAQSNEVAVSPATVMALKPTSSTSQSIGNSQRTPKVNSPKASASSDHEQKLQQLQKELNESESEKLDLQDRIQALEERLQEVTSAAVASSGEGRNKPDVGGGEAAASNLQETLRAKDLYIQQMEKQLAAAEAESKKVKVRLRKKVKNLTEQLNEAKQESSIAQLELKERNNELQEQLCHSSQGGMSAMAPKTSGEEEGDKDPKMKIILDLSAEVSEQSDRISMLERTVKQKDKEIERLKRELSTPRQTVQPAPSEQTSPSFRSHTLTQPIRSSSLTQQDPYSRHLKITGPSSHTGVAPVETVRDNTTTTHGNRPISKIGPRPTHPPQHRLEEELILHRQSTALSDSDSDWEVDMSSSKNRSAPARVRVKSAASSAHEMPTNRVDVEDKWSVATDDNDLTMTAEARPMQGSSSRQKRKSALKTRLERERNQRAKCLMGPSLAFGTPASDQLSDVSATPTPRHAHADLGSQFTTSDVMAFVA